MLALLSPVSIADSQRYGKNHKTYKPQRITTLQSSQKALLTAVGEPSF